MRTKKNLDGEEGRNAEAGAANMTPTDPLEEGEQTLIGPDCHHHEDLEGSGDDFEPEKKEESEKISEQTEADTGEELVYKGTSRSETENSGRRKKQSSLSKQSQNVTISSISPRVEQSSSRAKTSFKTLYDERITSP